MRKFLITLAVMLPFIVTSCDKNKVNGYFYPDYYSFVTAQVKDGKIERLVTDDGRSIVAENASVLKVKDQQRLVVYFSLLNKNDKDKEDALVRITGVDYDVEIGKCAIVDNQEQAKALGDNGTSLNLSPYRPQTTQKYINLYLGFNALKPEKHTFTLTNIKADNNDTKVVELVLCHNDNSDTSSGEYWTWVSFPVDQFEGVFAGKETVRVSIKTRMSGIKTIELPAPQMYNGDEAVLKGGDNSLM